MPSFRQIGLTGGIASGKSEVANVFRNAGIAVVDMDHEGRLISSNAELWPKFESILETKVVLDGKLDRTRIREIIFADCDKRKKLESFLHPLIRSAYEKKAKTYHSQGHRWVVCEAALLIENEYYKKLDSLIVVMASLALRKKRLEMRDGMSPKTTDQILEIQCKDPMRLKLADHVLQNDGSLETLKAQVQDLIQVLNENG